MSKNKTIKEIGEFGLIRRIGKILGQPSSTVLVGLGDDAAFVQPTHNPSIITTDTMIEGIHFRMDWCSAKEIAHKALASNLSDLAAKCAQPLYAVITIGLPADIEVSWVEDFYRELKNLGDQWHIEIIGGDTIRAPQVLISITAWGEQITNHPVLISQAKVGDQLLVSGTLGDAAAGLEILLQDKQRLSPESPYLLKRFHTPEPRHDVALQMIQYVIPSAMTDISDGLARDLPKLCHASKVGARVDSHQLSISKALQGYASEKAVEYAIRGGEDYELLFTVSKQNAVEFLAKWNQEMCPITVIGEIVPANEGIQFLGIPPSLYQGFDHFG